MNGSDLHPQAAAANLRARRAFDHARTFIDIIIQLIVTFTSVMIITSTLTQGYACTFTVGGVITPCFATTTFDGLITESGMLNSLFGVKFLWLD